MVLAERFRMFGELARSMGPAKAARHKVRRAWYELTSRKDPYALTARDAEFPLWCRPGTSDDVVFWQVFIDRQYACVTPRETPRVILDLGANVGYTTAYFLSRFPDAHVIAVEPDPGNAALLRKNVAAFGTRVTVIETGVWSKPVGLVMSTAPFRHGGEWARQVREARANEMPEMLATDLPSLVARARGHRIGILKMDIEGAEAEVFSMDCSVWISPVDTFAVEVHSQEAARAFERALGSDFEISRKGELTIAQRR